MASPGVPADWSFLQVGSSFTYNQETSQIVGRIRLQLRSDYKNFWCAAQPAGNYVWLMESFGSIALFGRTWTEASRSIKSLRANNLIKLSNDIKLRGEYVEKCERVNYEGELGDWRLWQPGFFVIQASNNDRRTAVFTVDSTRDVLYLVGERTDIETLNLQNILAWDEWK